MKKVLVGILILIAGLFLLSAPRTFAQDACEGNFDCDQDVDGTDAAVFKQDFGRSPFTDPCDTCFESPCPCATTSTTTTVCPTTTTTTVTDCPTFDLCSHPDDCIVGNCCCTDGENYVCDDEINCLDWGECVTTTTTCVDLEFDPCSEASDCCPEIWSDYWGRVLTPTCCCQMPWATQCMAVIGCDNNGTCLQ